MRAALLLLLILSFFTANAFAVIEHAQIKVLAVTSDGQGLGADLILDTERGTGKIWVSADPLVGTTTQSAARTAKDLAKKFSKEVDKFDYKFSVQSPASLVEGPSAGAAMALIIISSLEDKQVPSNVALTGTIDSQGNVGPVGGVFEKAKEASNIGIDLFLIPKGEEIQTVKLDGKVQSINLLEYAPANWHMKIATVNNIDDVITLAFSDVKSLDVSKIISEGAIPDFVPEPVVLGDHLVIMKEMVNHYIEKTNVIIEEAKNSASNSVIDNPELINMLLDTITSSEQTMKQAEILNEQNYLYSAANFAFLARVNALIVKDVSTNPSLLSLNATDLDLKVRELNQDIKTLEEALDKQVPIDYLEWYVSAQQRLSYAKVNVEKLSSTQVIVINGGDETPQAFERVSDYEFAVAWVDISKDFYDITKKSTKRVNKNDDFADGIDEIINKTQAILNSLPPETADDIQRRISSAQMEKAHGWYIASFFDAKTAYALASAETATQGMDTTTLFSSLESKINDLETKISQSDYALVWPALYLDHSKYFLESAKYFSGSGQTARAVNSLKSGISLATLAQELLSAAQPVYEHYNSIPQEQIISGPQPQAPTGPLGGALNLFPGFSNSLLLGGLLVVIVLFFIISVFFVIQLSNRPNENLPAAEISKVKEMQRKADSALMEGKVTEQKHLELSAKYSMELAILEKIHREKAAQVLELDKERAEILALEKRLRELKNHYKSGLITGQEFSDARKEMASKLLDTTKRIKETKKMLEPELKKENASTLEKVSVLPGENTALAAGKSQALTEIKDTLLKEKTKKTLTAPKTQKWPQTAKTVPAKKPSKKTAGKESF